MTNSIFRLRRAAKLAAQYVELDLLIRKVAQRGGDVRALRDSLAVPIRRDLRSLFAPELDRARLYRDVARLAYQRIRYGRCYVGTSGFCCDTGNFSDVRAAGFRSAFRTYRTWNSDPYISDGPSGAWVAAPSDDGYRYSQAPYGWGVN